MSLENSGWSPGLGANNPSVGSGVIRYARIIPLPFQPEGVIDGELQGDLFLNTTTGAVFVFNGQPGSKIGWTEMGTGGGASGDAPPSGSGSPEGVHPASPGRLYWDTDANLLYVKDTGTGVDGWIVAGTGGGGTATTPATTTEVNAFTDMVGAIVGATVTRQMLDDGTHLLGGGGWDEPQGSGGTDGWTIGPHMFTMRGVVGVGTDTFDPTANSRSLQLDNSIPLRWVAFTVPSGKRRISVGFYVKLTQAAEFGELYDLCRIDLTLSGAATVCQLRAGNGASGINFDMNIEQTNPSTTHSDRVLVSHNGQYWMTMQVDLDATPDPICQLAIFNATNGVLAGTIVYQQFDGPGENIGIVKFGNLETGASTGVCPFENIIFDWDEAKFPLFPNSQ